MVKRLGLLAAIFAGSLQAQTQMRGFADVGFSADLDGEPSSFGMGQYDNYLTSRLSDKMTFLSEVVFEYDGGWVLDVERVIVKYEFNNSVYVEGGKFHTPIGYWNNAYHHGALLEPTITRPHVVKFEDEGGILPIHTTGLQIAGENIGKYNFGYNLMVGNGLGSAPTLDNNPQKAITGGIKFEPIEGLQLGGSFYNDHLSSETETLIGGALGEGMNTQILSGYATFSKGNFEFIGEYHHVNNKKNSGTTTNSAGFYAYAGYTIGNFVPYFLYDNVAFDKNETYFMKNDVTMISPGVRYNLGLKAVLKLQYNMLDTEIGGQSNQLLFSAGIGF